MADAMIESSGSTSSLASLPSSTNNSGGGNTTQQQQVSTSAVSSNSMPSSSSAAAAASSGTVANTVSGHVVTVVVGASSSSVSTASSASSSSSSSAASTGGGGHHHHHVGLSGSAAAAAAAALNLNPIIPLMSVDLQTLQHQHQQQQQQQHLQQQLEASSQSVPPPPPVNNNNQSMAPAPPAAAGGQGGGIGSGGGSILRGSPDSQTSGEPEAKRKRLDSGVQPTVAALAAASEKLESRLGGILCCAVCLDLPKGAMYQCQMGHLMCAACFTHLLADGRLRDQVATCPNCRVEISKSTASRNLAVEKAVSELPSECQYCSKEYASKSLDRHEQNECEERPTACRYQRIGCQWKGPLHEAHEHQANCSHPKKSGAEVMLALEQTDANQSEEKRLFNTLIELLSYEKIIFNDLQLKPYRTDEYVHKLFYETSRFSAFNHQWVVKARINNSQRDPHTVNDRQITYQLILKTKTSSPLSIHFFGLKGPFSDLKINTQIYKHDFTDQENESEYYWMPLPDSSECNRLLAAKAINFRLIMFLLSK